MATGDWRLALQRVHALGMVEVHCGTDGAAATLSGNAAAGGGDEEGVREALFNSPELLEGRMRM